MSAYPFFDDLVTEQPTPSTEQRTILKRWDDLTFTIACPLPSGAVAFRAYWKAGGLCCEGYELPFGPLHPLLRPPDGYVGLP